MTHLYFLGFKYSLSYTFFLKKIKNLSLFCCTPAKHPLKIFPPPAISGAPRGSELPSPIPWNQVFTQSTFPIKAVTLGSRRG